MVKVTKRDKGHIQGSISYRGFVAGLGGGVSDSEHEGDLLFLCSLLVEPLRLFHPTVFHCIK